MVRKDFAHVFGEQKVDILLTPTTLTDAFPISKSLTPVQMYINDVMTIPASLAGCYS